MNSSIVLLALSTQTAFRNSLREVSHIDRLAEHLGVWQNIKSIADPALSVVIVASDASAVTMRTKALRALGQIVTSDPQIFRNVSALLSSLHHLAFAELKTSRKYGLQSSTISSTIRLKYATQPLN